MNKDTGKPYNHHTALPFVDAKIYRYIGSPCLPPAHNSGWQRLELHTGASGFACTAYSFILFSLWLKAAPKPRSAASLHCTLCHDKERRGCCLREDELGAKCAWKGMGRGSDFMCKAAALDYRSETSRASPAVVTRASQDFPAKSMGTRLMQDQARKSSSNRSLRFQTSMVMQPGNTAWLRSSHSQASSMK